MTLHDWLMTVLSLVFTLISILSVLLVRRAFRYLIAARQALLEAKELVEDANETRAEAEALLDRFTKGSDRV